MKKILYMMVAGLAVMVWSDALLAKITEVSSYCPLITAITQDPVKKDWEVKLPEGLWKSYHFSFANKITHFLGAQWNGENIGQVTCIYGSAQQFKENGKEKTQVSLPVFLTFNTLVYQPTGGKWRHSKRGIYNCRLRNAVDLPFDQSSCPFKIRMKSATTNIYKEAEKLKQ